MRTCVAVGDRQRDVIERIARTTQMLNTRVEVASEAINVGLLASMDRRSQEQLRLQQTVDSVADMLYQRVGITNEVPFSEFLFDDVPLADEPATQDTLLALTDESAKAEVLGDGLLEDSAERQLSPEELAQGREQVQAYEDAQRQEVAAETVEVVMPTESMAEVLPPETNAAEVKPV
jgi:hypothetical protein